MYADDRTLYEKLDTYNAYMAFCEAIGLPMLTNGTERDYIIEHGILYRICDSLDKEDTRKRKKVYSRNPKEIMLFENLLVIKSIL